MAATAMILRAIQKLVLKLQCSRLCLLVCLWPSNVCTVNYPRKFWTEKGIRMQVPVGSAPVHPLELATLDGLKDQFSPDPAVLIK